MQPSPTDSILQALNQRSPADAREALKPLNLHPGTAHVLSLFNYGHLPPHLAAASSKFGALAADIAVASANTETTVALRKLLEAKDAAVRASPIG